MDPKLEFDLHLCNFFQNTKALIEKNAYVDVYYYKRQAATQPP